MIMAFSSRFPSDPNFSFNILYRIQTRALQHESLMLLLRQNMYTVHRYSKQCKKPLLHLIPAPAFIGTCNISGIKGHSKIKLNRTCILYNVQAHNNLDQFGWQDPREFVYLVFFHDLFSVRSEI
jgi:hypothetical protein